MQEIISANIWDRIRRLARGRKPRLAAVAYVSTDRYVRFGRGDTLVTDASDAAIRSGETSARALSAVFGRGAEILNLPGLHAKMLVLGDVAVIGSANLSVQAATGNVEAAMATDSRAAVAGIKSLIYQLAEQATVVDEAFIKRIRRIPVIRRGRGGRQKPRSQVKVEAKGNSTWIVGVSDMEEDAHPEEQELAEKGDAKAKKRRTWRNSGISWIRWTGNDRFRKTVREGDSLIQISTPSGGKRATALRHATVLLRQDEGPGRTRFYIEEPPRSKELSLGAFRKALASLGFHGRIGTSSSRQISYVLSDELYRKWNTLQ